MDKIIPLRMNDVLINQLDQLVHNGIFTSRNEGIRSSLRSMLYHYQQKSTKVTNGHIIIARTIANFLGLTFPEIICGVVLFGSVATETQTDESDIDLLVILHSKISYDQEISIIGKVITLIGDSPYYPSLHFQEIEKFRFGIEHEFEFEMNIMKKGKVLHGHL